MERVRGRYSRQIVSEDHRANLFDLIRFGMGASRLQIEDFRDILSGKNVVTPSNSSFKTQMLQECAQIVKSNIRVGRPAEYLVKGLAYTAHGRLPTTGGRIRI